MDPSTPRCRRSRSRPITATTPRGKTSSSSGVLPRISPSTPRTKSSDVFCVSTPSTVHSELDDDFPFDSSGEWSIGLLDKKSSFQTPKREPMHAPLTKEKIRHIQKCSPLLSPKQQSPEEGTNTRRPRRRMSTQTDHSNETNDSSRRSSPRRKPRRTTSVKLEEEFLVLSSPTSIAASITPETPRRTRRSSSVEPRRRRTASVERRRTGGLDLPPRRRLSMTKIGSASPQAPEILTSPAARRLARHTQSVQQLLTREEKPLLLRNKSGKDLPFDWPDTPKRAFQ